MSCSLVAGGFAHCCSISATLSGPVANGSLLDSFGVLVDLAAENNARTHTHTHIHGPPLVLSFVFQCASQLYYFIFHYTVLYFHYILYYIPHMLLQCTYMLHYKYLLHYIPLYYTIFHCMFRERCEMFHGGAFPACLRSACACVCGRRIVSCSRACVRTLSVRKDDCERTIHVLPWAVCLSLSLSVSLSLLKR